MPFTRAARTQKYMHLALDGISGSGKTLSALKVAYGITGDWDKVAVIDTELGSACLYANRLDQGIGEFLHMNLEPPYTPQRYIDAIHEGERVVGPDGVLIIDSFSHAWMGTGGVLEQKDAIAKRSGRDAFSAWNEAGKMQQDVVNAVLGAKCHIIVTMRTKAEYASEENEKGKKTMRKIGMAPQQRDGVEYEFDIVLDLGQDHRAIVSKDRTGIGIDGEILTPEFGQRMKAWLATATPAPAQPMQQAPMVPQEPAAPPPQEPDAPPPCGDPQPTITAKEAAQMIVRVGGTECKLVDLYRGRKYDILESMMKDPNTDPMLMAGIEAINAYYAGRSPAAE